jgi:hypothetical protein
MYEIELVGADGVKKALGDLAIQSREAGVRLLARVANRSVTDIKEQLYPGHGLVTGHLRRSMTFEQRDNGMTVSIGTNVIYGPYIEFGSRRASRFLGYHMMRNTSGKVPGWIEEELRQAASDVSRAWGGL